MWIGYPSDVRQIKNPMRGLRIATNTNVTEHQMLSGAVRTTGRSDTPRRWNAEWRELSEVDSAWLRYLVRRTAGPGPFVVVDAATRNYQRPKQSIGRGSRKQWSTTSGTLAGQPDNSILWSGGANLGELRWQHPVWARWPIWNGMVMSFRHTATAHQAGLAFYNATGTLLTTITGVSGYVTGSAPAGAQWATPHLIKAGTGTLTVPSSCVRYGDTIGGAWFEGEHVAAMSLLDEADTIQHVPARDISLALLEF